VSTVTTVCLLTVSLAPVPVRLRRAAALYICAAPAFGGGTAGHDSVRRVSCTWWCAAAPAPRSDQGDGSEPEDGRSRPARWLAVHAGPRQQGRPQYVAT